MTSINTLRAALRAQFGTRQYRISPNGEIHVYGQMPNTGMTSWYLYGRTDSAETLFRLGVAQ